MLLRRKVLLAGAASIGAFALLLFLISYFIVLRSFAELETENTLDHLGRVRNAVAETLDNLSAVAGDWAHWDDTYAFVVHPEERYLTSNLVDSAFTDLDINLILILDAAGQLVAGRTFDLQSRQPAPIPRGLTTHFVPDDALLHRNDPEQANAGIIMLPEGPLLVASQAILSSNHDGPPRGTLIMGRYLDGQEIAHLSEMTRLPIVLSAYLTPDLPSDFQRAIARLSIASPSLVEPQRPDTVSGYTLLMDLYDEPALILRIDLARSIYAQGQASTVLLLSTLLITVVAFTVVQYLWLNGEVLSRIARLSRQVSEIAATRDLNQRVYDQGQDEIGSLTSMINTMLEALQRAESARKDSEERYRALFGQAADGILLIDGSNPENPSICDANAAASTLYGYTRQELMAMSIEQLRGADEEPVLPSIARTMPAGEAITFQATRRRKDGSRVPVEVSARVLHLEGKDVIQTIDRDITERRRLQEQLLQSQKMEVLGRLAGGIAHDFNNLLTVISGYGQFVLDRLPTSETARQDVEEMMRAAERAASLTRQLLAFSRRQVLEMQALDLNQVLAEVANMLERIIGETVRLEIRLAEGLPPVRADQGQLTQVIVNLAVNARDAMPTGGILTIETLSVTLGPGYPIRACGDLAPGKYVILKVSDTGLGISPEVMQHLFEPFFTTKGPGAGTGLGLATVYGILQQGGGGIAVESTPGCGSTFSAYLPCASGPADSGERPPSPPLAADS